MKKSILNLVGAQELSSNEQKSINGGKQYCKGTTDTSCPPGYCCSAVGSYCIIYGGSQGLCSAPIFDDTMF